MTVAEFALYLSSKILAEIFWAVINPQIISLFDATCCKLKSSNSTTVPPSSDTDDGCIDETVAGVVGRGTK